MKRVVVILGTITLFVTILRLVFNPGDFLMPVDAIAIFRDTYNLDVPLVKLVSYIRDIHLSTISLKDLDSNIGEIIGGNIGQIVEFFVEFFFKLRIMWQNLVDFLKFPVKMVSYSVEFLFELARWFVTLTGQIFNPYG